MKCRPLRRRYVVFKCSGYVDDIAVMDAICSLIIPRLPLKIILNQPPYLLLRTDNLSLEELKPRFKKELVVRCGGTELYPLASSGTIKKAREKIKKLIGNYEDVGMRKPSQSNRIKRC